MAPTKAMREIMAGRFGVPNRADPIWLKPLLERKPACMAVATWEIYVLGVRAEAVGDKTVRKALERGGMPNFCVGCTADYRARMQAANRCAPPANHVRERVDAE